MCRDTAEVKRAHPGLYIRYSFVVTWRGAFCNGIPIVENIDEIEAAARRAKSYLFDYISIKPFLFRCPVYRHVDKARIGDRNTYATGARFEQTKRETGRLIREFDASRECRKVTCLHNPVNWMIEELIEHPDKWDTLPALEDRRDYFL